MQWPVTPEVIELYLVGTRTGEAFAVGGFNSLILIANASPLMFSF